MNNENRSQRKKRDPYIIRIEFNIDPLCLKSINVRPFKIYGCRYYGMQLRKCDFTSSYEYRKGMYFSHSYSFAHFYQVAPWVLLKKDAYNLSQTQMFRANFGFPFLPTLQVSIILRPTSSMYDETSIVETITKR